MAKFFSIIIPAYNVDGYIENTVTSIISQDFTNYELILVDDGSTDATAAVCRKLAMTRPECIKFVSRTHGGVSAARNEGLKLAGGNYVMLVDGDDYLSDGSLSYLHQVLCTGYPDLLCFDFVRTVSMKDTVERIDDETVNDVLDPADAIAWKLGEKTIPCYASCIKNSLIREKGIYFDEDLTYVEDALFLFRCMLASKSVWRNRNVLYFYLQRPGSATHLDFFPASVGDMELKAWKRIRRLVSSDLQLKRLVSKRMNPIRRGCCRRRLKELLFQLPQIEAKCLHIDLQHDNISVRKEE